jgi:dTDP-glucose 4,6-dehydratase
VYNIGGASEMTNIDVVHALCDILGRLVPLSAPVSAGGVDYRALIAFVSDRPGHDRRYAVDTGKIARELGWQPQESFASGLEKTVQWYLNHPGWVGQVLSGAYLERSRQGAQEAAWQ